MFEITKGLEEFFKNSIDLFEIILVLADIHKQLLIMGSIHILILKQRSMRELLAL
jgi:hypothetical protein